MQFLLYSYVLNLLSYVITGYSDYDSFSRQDKTLNKLGHC